MMSLDKQKIVQHPGSNKLNKNLRSIIRSHWLCRPSSMNKEFDKKLEMHCVTHTKLCT